MPIYRCVVCGKEWKEGCDSISGWIDIFIYTVCDECVKKARDRILTTIKDEVEKK